jgi:hypothetical protein
MPPACPVEAHARSYPGGRDPQATAAAYAALTPEAKVKAVGEKVFVRGLLEDHERITSPRQPSPTPKTVAPTPGKVPLANKRFTLTITERPVGPFVKDLASQLNLELVMDEEAIRRAGIALDGRVSFKVKEATVDQLFQAALGSTGLAYRRQGSRIHIGPVE